MAGARKALQLHEESEDNVDDDRQNAERELMHLNGQMAKLMDQISGLEAIVDPEPSQERLLEELKIEEGNLSGSIEDVEGRL